MPAAAIIPEWAVAQPRSHQQNQRPDEAEFDVCSLLTG
jgi:hypothetical protein